MYYYKRKIIFTLKKFCCFNIANLQVIFYYFSNFHLMDLFLQELIEDLNCKTFGNFKKLLKALLTPKIMFYAKELNNALVGLGTDERTLIDILCNLSNSEINALRVEYENRKLFEIFLLLFFFMFWN